MKSDAQTGFLSALRRETQDITFRRRLRNIGHLLTGNAVNAVMALIAIALTARALGPHSYGILAMAFTYARAVERLVTFQSWQPLIRYGAALDTPDRQQDLKALLKFGLLLDLLGALASFLLAAGLVFLLAPHFGWSDEVRRTILLCCLMLPFNINGMPTAILRLQGRFRQAAWGPVTGTILRMVGCALALAAGSGLATFALIWAATQAVGYLIFLAMGLVAARRQGLGGFVMAPLGGIRTQFRGIWRFAILSNISLSIRSSANQLDVLIVGALAGPVGAGLYHIARRAGRLAEQLSVQAQAVLFPDIARLWSAGDAPAVRRAVWQLELVLMAAGLAATIALWLVAEPLIRLAMGVAFVGAAPLLVVQMLAVTFSMAGSGARSALLAMGQEGRVLGATLLGTALFHATAFTLVPMIGPMGANIAHLALGVVASGLMIWWCRAALR